MDAKNLPWYKKAAKAVKTALNFALNKAKGLFQRNQKSNEEVSTPQADSTSPKSASSNEKSEFDESLKVDVEEVVFYTGKNYESNSKESDSKSQEDEVK